MIKIGAVAVMMLLFLIIYMMNPAFFNELWEVCLSGDMELVAAYINSFGPWAMLFSFLLVLCVNAIGFPPAIIFSSANALIFGIVPGIILSWIAETVGVTISFLLLRFLFREAAEEAIAKNSYLKQIDDVSGRDGFKVMLIARLVPYLPSGVLNAVGALSKMSLKAYVLAALIGKLPSTAIEAMIGHDAVTASENPYRLVFNILLAVAVVGAFFIYEKHNKKNKKQEDV
ncbi:MAG: TVP38/TMEM64 family protein [Anaerovibrio sp.]|nr:TVP38/TMEM64 family protein [Anaerovibrio sp.]